MAHKKGVGSTDNGRDSKSKRLGVKIFGGQFAKAGNIIVRQRGTKFHPGENVYMGKDFSLHARVDGTVTYLKRRQNRTFVNVLPDSDAIEAIKQSKKAVAKQPAAPVVEEVVEERSVEAAAPAPQPEEIVIETDIVQEAETPAAVEEAPVVEEAPKEKPKPAKKAAAAKVTLPSGKKIKMDDLKMVEGVGPKIEGLLNEGGIHTWHDLATAELDKVQAILDEAGPRYKMHNPATWAKQALLAHEGKWEELEDYQGKLKGGREVE